MRLPLVAIVGAPNVGKSTLFNRLVGRRTAIVTDEPGVTRDRLYGEVRDAPLPFRVVDTGGLTPSTAAPFAGEIGRQADAALGEACLILFVVDARAGVTAVDREVAELLRRRSLPIIPVANKIDGPKVEHLAHELYALGLGDPAPVSAEHAIGVDELLDRVADVLEEQAPQVVEDDTAGGELRISIVGRPNVGKSSLLNRLAGEERVVVSDIPGTTRDAVDTLLTRNGRRYRLIDTAGMRKRGKPREAAERFSIARARNNVESCDVAILVLDASEGFAAQDAHIAGFVRDAARPLVVAVNKWDLIEEREREAARWLELVRERLRFVKRAPMVLVSAKSGQRVARLLEEADSLHETAGVRVSTPELNRWLQDVAGPELRTPRGARGPRVYYATQTGLHPPSFVVFCNDPARIHFSFRRYLENTLRERFGFGGVPLRLRFRPRRERRGG